MKNSSTPVLSLVFALFSFISSAQNQTIPLNEPDYNRPRLFQNLPDNIVVSMTNINSLLNLEVGRAVNINLSATSQFQFQGDVVSIATDNDNGIRSVVVRSTNFPGARLSISKISNPDGTISYKGRIISFQHGDMFDLQSQNGQFVLVKRNFYDIVNE